MMLEDFCKKILFGPSLEDKLFFPKSIEMSSWKPFAVPIFPERSQKIKFSSKNFKFPKGNFHEVEKKARALHSFANHELLAIEMMACALLMYPHDTKQLLSFKKGILSALKDEQIHFKLYQARLNQLGHEFGDFPLNAFFWSQMNKLTTPSKYLATMSLTFEAANLDFAHFYMHIFKELGDFETSDILKVVLKDEIAHVGLGVHFLGLWKKDKTLWEYYNSSLPYPITPARSKGSVFVEHVRLKAKMDTFFIDKLKQYSDPFKVTQRKEWKK